jgi:hypothetical protein
MVPAAVYAEQTLVSSAAIRVATLTACSLLISGAPSSSSMGSATNSTSTSLT